MKSALVLYLESKVRYGSPDLVSAAAAGVPPGDAIAPAEHKASALAVRFEEMDWTTDIRAKLINILSRSRARLLTSAVLRR